MRVLSGIQPSGSLHIGNYFGMIKPMVEHQADHELFCFLANMHSLTSVFDGKKIFAQTNEALIDMIALGIDPEKSTLWVQSDVPEVTELTWYLSPITPMGLLERCHSYKDKVAKNIPASAGLFTYPVLMAADILLYRSDIVPVGKDQKQHVEVTRDIAIKFNATYGEIFTIPEPKIKEEVAVVPGIDGQKMSKSYGNAIDIFATEKDFKKVVMSIVTDPTPLEEPKNPDTCTIYQLYKLVASPEQLSTMADKLRAGGYGYGDAKKALLAAIWEYFLPFRAKREELIKNPDYVAAIRKRGAEKARAVASDVLGKVRKAVGTGM